MPKCSKRNFLERRAENFLYQHIGNTVGCMKKKIHYHPVPMVLGLRLPEILRMREPAAGKRWTASRTRFASCRWSPGQLSMQELHRACAERFAWELAAFAGAHESETAIFPGFPGFSMHCEANPWHQAVSAFPHTHPWVHS